ncbi:DUF2946 family protein [Acidovorax radicis]|uniref:DUF2946 family protein n=1 Tax=Acidovorax radicis TaxID=758826 RepID=UPI001CFAF1D9|nr:DUF2946 family protein [Acidovorax radicis]UCV00324.1 hypothetical protein KI609_05940 [Acidovorax radicis]
MLERLRRNHHLTLAVLFVFGLALSAALLAGMQTRKALHLVDVCTTIGSEGPPAAQATAPFHDNTSSEALAHQGHEGSPACALCLALSTPSTVAQWAYRPPSAHVGHLWTGPELPRVAKATAPPPPSRAPPDQQTA